MCIDGLTECKAQPRPNSSSKLAVLAPNSSSIANIETNIDGEGIMAAHGDIRRRKEIDLMINDELTECNRKNGADSMLISKESLISSTTMEDNINFGEPHMEMLTMANPTHKVRLSFHPTPHGSAPPS